MKIILATVALVLGTVSASAASAADKPMNYDCTKAGNKNKAACKGAAPAASAAAAKPAAMPAAAKPAATPAPAAAAKVAKPMTYDCTKAGNKNKAACKGGAAPAAPIAVAAPVKPLAPIAAAKSVAPLAPVAAARPAAPLAPLAPVKPRAAKAPAAVNPNLVAATLKNGKVVHYDCSKAGNQTKTACKK